MRGIFRLFVCCGRDVGRLAYSAIRLLYNVSWRESMEIANCFVEDLLG